MTIKNEIPLIKNTRQIEENKKTLILYTSHNINNNFKFFISNGGLLNNPNYFYLLILNSLNPDTKNQLVGLIKKTNPDLTNFLIITRENQGNDFGGWSFGLFSFSQFQEYDRFIFLNSTVKGPFFPKWIDDIDWVKKYNSLLNEEVKLAGISLNTTTHTINGFTLKYFPHVQSMFMATDRIGLNIGIEKKIFVYPLPKLISFVSNENARECYIKFHEIKFSTKILKNNYKITCMLKGLSQNFKNSVDSDDKIDPFNGNSYYGSIVHPYETIFIKENRYKDGYGVNLIQNIPLGNNKKNFI